MVKLATQLIERQEGKFAPADTEDHYETRLREVIAAKLKGEGITPEAPEARARQRDRPDGGAEGEPGPRRTGGSESTRASQARGAGETQSSSQA